MMLSFKNTKITKQNQQGSSAVEIIAIIVIVGLIAVVGWFVYDRQNSKKASNSSTQTQEKSNADDQSSAQESDYTSLKLASEKVQFEIPKSWIVEKSNCIDTPGAAPACVDGAALIPSEKMPTIYGDGTEYFTIYAQVYDNKDNKTAQRWFEDVYQGGSSQSSDKVSRESINGYDTYYFRQINPSYDEIRYVYAANGKVVLVIARVSEKSFASDGSGTVSASLDFTKYIPEIEKMAKTIKIN